MAPHSRESRGEEEHNESEEESQPAEAVIRAQSLVNTSKKRREAKRKLLEAEHKKHVKELRHRIDNAYAVRNTKLANLQGSYWKRLEALNTKRENLEKLILVSMKQTELQTKNIASELLAMFEGRQEDFSEMPEIKDITLPEKPKENLDATTLVEKV
ncbi:hypothetical protein BJ875DRAFT_32264 [Amylocarpus encephaloides]|uniref:Uncharacterized protein n=1 Tax=Amylocarpus encephaloides TaxID=45428 RepID=A0A9P7YRD1_9HELO|nr:hypothetical protein BJ875DRAFT_32264 [Amylocarpus encephaloides]